MPLYEYRCENGHTFEVMQRMSDAPVATCSECGAPVQRVFHPVAVHFKGSGFYTTDYGRKKSGTAEQGESKKDSSSDSKGGDSTKKDAPSKSDSSKSDSSKSGD